MFVEILYAAGQLGRDLRGLTLSQALPRDDVLEKVGAFYVIDNHVDSIDILNYVKNFNYVGMVELSKHFDFMSNQTYHFWR